MLAAWELIRPGRAAAVLEERSRLIAELEGEVAAMKESLAAAEAAAEAERVGFDEKITKMKTLLQVCRSATFVPSTTYQCEPTRKQSRQKCGLCQAVAVLPQILIVVQ